MIYKYFVIYILIINIIGFIINFIDKSLAIHHKWRIPEKALWITALLGGSIGSYVSMRIFHHKTKHKNFMILIPTIIFLQFAALIAYFILNNNAY